MKNILAFDTSLQGFSLGVYNIQTQDSYCVIRPRMRGQAEQLIPQIQHMLSLQKKSFNDIDLVATTSGPGSFTGLRVGLSVAKSLKTSLLNQVISINTHEALAAQFLYNISYNSSKTTPNHILVITETQRQDFYMRHFTQDSIQSLYNAPATQSLTKDDIAAFIHNISTLTPKSKKRSADMHDTNIHLIGDGVPRFIKESESSINPPFGNSPSSNIPVNIIQHDGYDLIDPRIFAQYAFDLVQSMPKNINMAECKMDNPLYNLSPIYLRDADISKPKKTYRKLQS